MNTWFPRFTAGLPGSPQLELTREEARLLLDLAGAAARSAGARQFAPIATYLAGRAAAAASEEERLSLLRAAAEAAGAAGTAEPLGID
jgi:uncharacterized protein DUF6457